MGAPRRSGALLSVFPAEDYGTFLCVLHVDKGMSGLTLQIRAGRGDPEWQVHARPYRCRSSVTLVFVDSIVLPQADPLPRPTISRTTWYHNTCPQRTGNAVASCLAAAVHYGIAIGSMWGPSQRSPHCRVL